MFFKAILNFEFVKVLASVQNAHVKGYVIGLDVLNQYAGLRLDYA